MEAIKVHDLAKRYQVKKVQVTAVDRVSFAVETGELFGIIGPDGAGKTSLFRMLTTLLLPDGGSAYVDGSEVVKDYKTIRKKVGYMPGRFSLYQDLTIEENLQFFATIFNTTVRENYSLIKEIYVQIEPFKTRRAGQLSGGMKQKLALCCALIHRPVVLFLDEPTTGVDAVSRREFWDMLQRLKQEGITILVSTPYMDEAALCDRVALMQNGKILSAGTPAFIRQSFPDQLIAVKSANMFGLLRELPAWSGTKDSYAFGEYHHVVLRGGYDGGQLQHWLEEKGYHDLSLHPSAANIEDCFMQLMKN